MPVLQKVIGTAKMKKKQLTKSVVDEIKAAGRIMGGDMEVFAVGLDGRVIPADAPGFFQYSKDYPMSQKWGKHHKVFADGVQIEVNFSPGYCRDGIIGCMYNAIWEAQQIAAKKKAELHAVSAVKMEQKDIDVGGYLSHMMGCNPDFSAYSDVPNRPIEGYATHPIRTAGYHIQFGHEIKREEERKFARLCDRIIGLIAMWGDRDESHILRKGDGVGLAGCFRNHPDQCRFEYRTVGSFWLRNAALSHAIFGVARMVSHVWSSGLADVFISQIDDDECRAAINNCDNDSCRRLAMRILPALADAAKRIDPSNSMSRLRPQGYGEPLGMSAPQPVHALVWMLDGNIKYSPVIGNFLRPTYGWVNYSDNVLRNNKEFMQFQKEFDGELGKS